MDSIGLYEKLVREAMGDLQPNMEKTSAYKSLRYHLIDLMDFLDVELVLPKLLANNTLSSYWMQLIQSKKTYQQKNVELVYVIMKTGFDGFRHFVSALRTTGQHCLAERLENTYNVFEKTFAIEKAFNCEKQFLLEHEKQTILENENQPLVEKIVDSSDVIVEDDNLEDNIVTNFDNEEVECRFDIDENCFCPKETGFPKKEKKATDMIIKRKKISDV